MIAVRTETAGVEVRGWVSLLECEDVEIHDEVDVVEDKCSQSCY